MITLKPSAQLNDYAKAHLKELQFGQEVVLEKQHEVRPLNWFGRAVKKVHESPTKIAKLALTILLAVSLVGIPLIWLYHKELRAQAKEEKLKQNVIDSLNFQVAKLNQRAVIVEKLEIKNFQKLPYLDLKGRMGPSGYIDFLQPPDMTESLMKGTDIGGRAFFACKLAASDSKNPFVVTLFERYPDTLAVWTWGGDRPCDGQIYEGTGGNGRINTEKAYTYFRNVLNGQNPQLRLV